MPSGAKKRKAAKKRKEKEEAHNTSSIQGDEDLKTHDEKESDGGETSSPMSQDHHNQQHPFTEGDVEKREDTSSARSFVIENKSMEESEHNVSSTQRVGVERVGIVQIDTSLKPEYESETKNIRNVESAKESHNRGSSEESRSSTSSSSGSSGSNSSSDDESRVVEKKIVVVEAGDSKEESYDLVSESTFGDKISALETQIVDSVRAEEALDKVSLPEEVVHVTESAEIDNSVISGLAEPELTENGGKTLPSGNENSGVSSVLTHLESERKGDIVVTTSEENEDKLLLSFNPPRVDTSNGAEHVKDSEIPECSDSQPLVASAPRPVQTTSWKSCCGLFEVLSSSNR